MAGARHRRAAMTVISTRVPGARAACTQARWGQALRPADPLAPFRVHLRLVRDVGEIDGCGEQSGVVGARVGETLRDPLKARAGLLGHRGAGRGSHGEHEIAPSGCAAAPSGISRPTFDVRHSPAPCLNRTASVTGAACPGRASRVPHVRRRQPSAPVSAGAPMAHRVSLRHVSQRQPPAPVERWSTPEGRPSFVSRPRADQSSSKASMSA